MRNIKQKWHALRVKLHLQDAHQRAALSNILRFFALMVVLTLVARAMANAAVPTVTTAFASRGILTQSISVQGSIAAAGSVPLAVPAGITVQSVAVKEGETVEKGQAIAAFDNAEIADILAMTRAQVKKLTVTRAQLYEAKPEHADTVAGAQQALDWAYADYRAACDVLTILQAQTEPDLPAIAAASEKVAMTLRAAQQAEQARNAAYNAYETADAAAKDSAQSNAADAKILTLQIEEKQKDIADLQALQDAGSVLRAPISGTVQALKLAVGQASEKAACNIADAAKGQLFLCTVDAENADKAQVGSAIAVTQKDAAADAKVSAVELRADDTAQITVRLTKGDFKNGAASGVMTLSEKNYELCLPASAVHQDNAGAFVYTLEAQNTVLGEQQILVRMPVTVLENGKTLTAVSGALGGAAVVSGADKPLANGARVKVAA
ncbi:MAG: biotin/lipoyl-binding protein [Ruthenibacterium sp.]